MSPDTSLRGCINIFKDPANPAIQKEGLNSENKEDTLKLQESLPTKRKISKTQSIETKDKMQRIKEIKTPSTKVPSPNGHNDDSQKGCGHTLNNKAFQIPMYNIFDSLAFG